MFFTGCSLDYLLSLGGLWLVTIVAFSAFVRGQPWKSRRRLTRTLAKPVVTILALMLFGLSAETIFVMAYDTTDAFSVTKISQRWYERHVKRNNYGFRDQKDFVPTKKEKKRILLVGDSFAFGHGVARASDRFGDILEKRLRPVAPDWEIYNVSIPGLGTKSEVELLDKLKKESFEYDLILLAYCMNDAEDLSDGTAKTVGTIILDYPSLSLVRESYLLNFLYYRYKQLSRPEIRRYFHWIGYVYEGEMWREQQYRFHQLQSRCRESSAEFLVVTFPFLYDLSPAYEFEKSHQTLEAYWQSKKVPHLDLLPLLREHRSEGLLVNKFDSHPNERAHALAANQIWTELLEPALRDHGRSVPK